MSASQRLLPFLVTHRFRSLVAVGPATTIEGNAAKQGDQTASPGVESDWEWMVEKGWETPK